MPEPLKPMNRFRLVVAKTNNPKSFMNVVLNYPGIAIRESYETFTDAKKAMLKVEEALGCEDYIHGVEINCGGKWYLCTENGTAIIPQATGKRPVASVVEAKAGTPAGAKKMVTDTTVQAKAGGERAKTRH